MKCPVCEFENPEGMNFCVKGARSLRSQCPQCDFENPNGFAFWGKCGTSLAAADGSTVLLQTQELNLQKLLLPSPMGATRSSASLAKAARRKSTWPPIPCWIETWPGHSTADGAGDVPAGYIEGVVGLIGRLLL